MSEFSTRLILYIRIKNCFKHLATYLCIIPLLLEVPYICQTMDSVVPLLNLFRVPLNMEHYYGSVAFFQSLVYPAGHTYILRCVFLSSCHHRMSNYSWVQSFCLQLLHGSRWTCFSIICKTNQKDNLLYFICFKSHYINTIHLFHWNFFMLESIPHKTETYLCCWTIDNTIRSDIIIVMTVLTHIKGVK